MAYNPIRLPSDGDGKNLYAIATTISGGLAYMEVHALVDSSGVIISPTNPLWIQSSGQGVILPSTQQIQISGQGTFLPATQVVKISGDMVVVASGGITGVTATVTALTSIKTGAVKRVTGVSGGTVLFSGVVQSVTMKSLDGDIYVGGSGNNRPYSGFGFLLDKGEGVSFDVSNFDAIYVCAPATSGNRVSFYGVN